MRLLFFIILAVLLILFQFTLSGKIAVFNVRPNLVLIFLVLIASTATEAKQKSEKKLLSLSARKNYISEAGAKWQFFLITALCGLIFDILSTERGNGFYFTAFLLAGALVSFLFYHIPLKNFLFLSVAVIAISAFIFNAMFSLNIAYSFSKNQLIELVYNTVLLILILGAINFRKFLKILRV